MTDSQSLSRRRRGQARRGASPEQGSRTPSERPQGRSLPGLRSCLQAGPSHALGRPERLRGRGGVRRRTSQRGPCPCGSGHTRGQPPRSLGVILRICCYSQFANILLRIFASEFTSDIGMYFSFLGMSSSGFGVRVILAILNGLQSVLSSSIFWKSLRSVGTFSSLNVFDRIRQGSYVGLAFLCEKIFNCLFNFFNLLWILSDFLFLLE